MPRYPNFPTTTDETQRLELSVLRRLNLLRPGHFNKTLTWSSRGEKTGEIGLVSHIDPEGGSFLHLSYIINGEKKYHYPVELESVPSNLPGSGGHRWYMVCPVTGRRATVLYLRSGTGMFAHREAFTGSRLYYDSQLEPKRFRGMGSYFAAEREWESEYRKGRKTHYRGKPTRWYARLLRLDAEAGAAVPGLLQMFNGL